MRSPRQRGGFVLIVVLAFGLLLAANVATLARRAVVDSMIAKNRDRAAQAAALARGGLRLGTALLLEDRLREQAEEFRSESTADVWTQVNEIATQDGGVLRLRIEDAGARLNLNALFREGAPIDDVVAIFLEAALERVIENMPGLPEEKFYDVEALVDALIDYIDADEVSVRGGSEDDLNQQPPYRAANRPLLSVDELREVSGFDAALVDALRPYVTVYPYRGGGGINPNTAPPHVLSLAFACEATGTTCGLLGEDEIRDVLRARQDDQILCGASAGPQCTSVREVIPQQLMPEPAYESDVFFVVAQASVGDITRTLEAWVDRSNPTHPLLMSWRMR